MVPVSLGRVSVWFCVSVAGSRVVKKEELLSETKSSPVFAILNRVIPLAEATNKSPLFV